MDQRRDVTPIVGWVGGPPRSDFIDLTPGRCPLALGDVEDDSRRCSLDRGHDGVHTVDGKAYTLTPEAQRQWESVGGSGDTSNMSSNDNYRAVPGVLIERIMDALLEVPPSSANADLYGILSDLLVLNPTADTIMIDDPVAGRIEQRVRRRSHPPQPAMLLGHDFLPVAGHPDEDECTYRADGTDASYCGATLGEHIGATQAQVDQWWALAKQYPVSKPVEPPKEPRG